MKNICSIALLMCSVFCFGQDDKRGTIRVSKNDCFKTNKNDAYYTAVDSMPEFPGGESALNTYINTVQAPKGSRNGFSASAEYSFIVLADGSISVLDLKSANEEIKSGITDMLVNMPKWKPGKCNGKTVPVKREFKWKVSIG